MLGCIKDVMDAVYYYCGEGEAGCEQEQEEG